MHKFPVFIFRSVIGKELYKLSCILRTQKCETCPVNKHCIYAKIFTTPVSSNETFKGNKKPHPFTLSVDLPLNQNVESAVLKIRMIGETYKLFPYLFFAVKQAGEKGIFRDRIKFQIENVYGNYKKLFIEKDRLDLELTPYNWELNLSKTPAQPKKIKILFKTPAKITRDKKLVRNLDYEEFIKNGLRRLKLLSFFYGENPDVYIDLKEFLNMDFREKALINTRSYRYFSFRQNKAVNMKGFVGEIEVEKEFLPVELSLLKGIETFGIGKATSFGFGHTRIVEV